MYTAVHDKFYKKCYLELSRVIFLIILYITNRVVYLY